MMLSKGKPFIYCHFILPVEVWKEKDKMKKKMFEQELIHEKFFFLTFVGFAFLRSV